MQNFCINICFCEHSVVQRGDSKPNLRGPCHCFPSLPFPRLIIVPVGAYTKAFVHVCRKNNLNDFSGRGFKRISLFLQIRILRYTKLLCCLPELSRGPRTDAQLPQIPSASVPDPWHFGADPDPWIRTLTNVSGSGCGSCSFRQWPSRCQIFLCLFLFEGTFTSFFEENYKLVTKQ